MLNILMISVASLLLVIAVAVPLMMLTGLVRAPRHLLKEGSQKV